MSGSNQKDDNPKNAIGTIPQAFYIVVTTVITCLVTLYVALDKSETERFSYEISAQSDTQKSLYARISELENSLALRDKQQIEQNQKIFELTSRVMKLTIELERKYDNHYDLKAIIDGSPNVAWFNLVMYEGDDVTFPMYHINKRFEHVHGITLAKFKGQTASKVLPTKIATHFRENNLAVWNTRSGGCFIETYTRRWFLPVSDENPLIDNLVCRWVVPFEGSSYGIFGHAIPIEEIKDMSK